MIRRKWVGALTALCMTAAVLLTILAYINPPAFESAAVSMKYASEIDKSRVMSIQIIADEGHWTEMLENARDESYIPATVIINGVKVENVGIRPKGNSSLSTVAQDSTTDRYSFKIEFDHYIEGQTWLGLDKLALNNMQGDSSYMKEYLSYDIMAYAGVDAPLYAFSDISVNGESWGFYLAVETLEESYAQRAFGSNHGKLYKPESMGARGAGRMNEFLEQMDNNARPEGMPQQRGEQRGGMGMGGMSASGGVALQYDGDDLSAYAAIFDNAVFKSGQSDQTRVVEALKKLSSGQGLESAVDVEACLSYFAAHTMVVNLDSYISNMAHNYYLYEKDGRLTILPWDYNLAFGGFQSGSASAVVNFPIDTPVSGVTLESRPLLGKLLEVPEYKELYHGYLRKIVEGYFDDGLFEQTINSLDTLISAHVEADPSAFSGFEEYKAAVSELKKLGLLRAESVAGQLDGTVPSTSEGQSAEPDRLTDASDVNLRALGSQGGGGMRGGFEEGGEMPNARFGENRGQGFAGMGENAPAMLGNRAPVQQQQPDNNIPSWIFQGVCVLLLIAGTVFVLLFKRRM